MSGFELALVLSLASAFCYGGAAVAQRELAGHIPTRPPRGAGSTIAALLTHRLGWLAILLNTVGAVLHVAALAYGALIAVQPLSTLALAFALPWSAMLRRRRVTTREWHGAILTAMGLSVMLLATDTAGHEAPLGTSGVVLLLAVTGTTLGLLAAAASRLGHPWRRLVLAASAGIAFGVASALITMLTHQFSTDPDRGVTVVVSSGLVVLAVSGMLLSQVSYQGMDVGAPLATLSLCNPVAAGAIGVGVMGEQYLGGMWGLGVSLLAGIVAARGVVLLAVPAAVTVPRAPRGRKGPPAQETTTVGPGRTEGSARV